MSSATRTHLAAALGLTVLAGLSLGVAPPQAPKAPAAPAYRISGPYTHDNLTIFLLHGEDEVKGKKFLTLDEALKDKKVVVHETKNVSQLAIENVSGEEVFIQAGDIVKGGQQDRTITIDLIIPPQSGKLPLNTFCVEQGRWSKRGGEDSKSFNSSSRGLSGNALKYACRKDNSQGAVWRNVARAQMQLEANLKADVKSKASETSYQLTLENKKLLDAVGTYVKKLDNTLADQKDVIGFAVAINGQVNNADVYANADLFRKLWPKLLQASAIEAVAEKKEGAKVAAVKPENVKVFLAEVGTGKLSEKALNKKLREVQQETEKNILFETREDKVVIRRSYLKK
jgi:hypothetical protein